MVVHQAGGSNNLNQVFAESHAGSELEISARTCKKGRYLYQDQTYRWLQIWIPNHGSTWIAFDSSISSPGLWIDPTLICFHLSIFKLRSHLRIRSGSLKAAWNVTPFLRKLIQSHSIHAAIRCPQTACCACQTSSWCKSFATQFICYLSYLCIYLHIELYPSFCLTAYLCTHQSVHRYVYDLTQLSIYCPPGVTCLSTSLIDLQYLPVYLRVRLAFVCLSLYLSKNVISPCGSVLQGCA